MKNFLSLKNYESLKKKIKSIRDKVSEIESEIEAVKPPDKYLVVIKHKRDYRNEMRRYETFKTLQEAKDWLNNWTAGDMFKHDYVYYLSEILCSNELDRELALTVKESHE